MYSLGLGAAVPQTGTGRRLTVRDVTCAFLRKHLKEIVLDMYKSRDLKNQA